MKRSKNKQRPFEDFSYRVAVYAMGKQVAKKPIRAEDGRLVCPVCRNDTIFPHCSECCVCEYQLNYCNNCGQRLDWEDETQC